MDIRVYDSKFKMIDIIDSYESFIWTDRYEEFGDFELKVPITHPKLYCIMNGHYFEISDSPNTMMIESILSSDTQDSDMVTITGRSLDCVIDFRVIDSHVVIDSKVQDAVRKLIEDYLGKNAVWYRRIDNLIFEINDSVPDANVQVQVSGESLTDAIVPMLSDIGCGIAGFRRGKNIVIKILCGLDRTSSQTKNRPIVFSSENDNLLEVNTMESLAELKTAIYGGGSENWENRGVYMLDNYPTWNGINRREAMISTDVTKEDVGDRYQSLIETEIRKELGKYTITAVEGVVAPNTSYIYGVDYSVGDIVEVRNSYGMIEKCRITEFIISSEESGTTMYPTFKPLVKEQ